MSRDLEEQLGWSESRIDQMLSRGGLRIYTCVDRSSRPLPRRSIPTAPIWTIPPGMDSRLQSSITIIDNSTGDVVAIVGQFGEKEGNLLSNYANDTGMPGSPAPPSSPWRCMLPPWSCPMSLPLL